MLLIRVHPIIWKSNDLADDLGVGLHIHLAETETEVKQIKADYGCRPIELMAKIGLLKEDQF